MIDWITTSSVLVLIIIAIRFCSKRHISPMLRYALWLIVLVRLLLPFNLFESTASVMNIASSRIPSSQLILSITENVPTFSYVNSSTLQQQDHYLSINHILIALWILGMLLMLYRTIVSNRTFYRRLQLSRQLQTDFTDPARPRLYLVPGLASPCLFGLIHPSIYITEAAAADPQTLSHAIAHEKAHYRHGDHIWSLLRLAALILHWYNPLVWLACHLSKQDCELAADASAIKSLGDQHRLAYGHTLIRLAKPNAAILTLGTTVVSGMISPKRALRKRIVTLARNQRTNKLAALVVLVLSIVTISCTFTSAVSAAHITRSIYKIMGINSLFDSPVAEPITFSCSNTLRSNIASVAADSNLQFADVSDVFLEWTGCDADQFQDFCMYQLSDGSFIGAASISETFPEISAIDLRKNLIVQARDQNCSYRMTSSDANILFSIGKDDVKLSAFFQPSPSYS